MHINISDNPEELGRKAGSTAAKLIQEAIDSKGNASIILATGTSQFETLRQLVSEPDIAWDKVTMFHLDEYIGLSISSPASFRKYLQERFINKVSPLLATHLINGETDALSECERLNGIIKAHAIDVALIGIGENGHLAFNDPPADFNTYDPYIIVELDEQCRKQQMGEGWFKTLADVPTKAISMSVQQILKSIHIICSVPDQRKAEAVRNSLEKPVSNFFPASILQTHPHCQLFLDTASASLLTDKNL